jgi:hypothetical protein
MTHKDITYLRSLPAIRERCYQVLDLARQNRLKHFTLHEDRLPLVINHVLELIRQDYATPADIPPHSRMRSFEVDNVDRLARLRERWSDVDVREQTRRLIDLCVVSVLVDAGAGDHWAYTEAATGRRYSRTEGLGLAALAMFESGAFSSDPQKPYQADGKHVVASYRIIHSH